MTALSRFFILGGWAWEWHAGHKEQQQQQQCEHACGRASTKTSMQKGARANACLARYVCVGSAKFKQLCCERSQPGKVALRHWPRWPRTRPRGAPDVDSRSPEIRDCAHPPHYLRRRRQPRLRWRPLRPRLRPRAIPIRCWRCYCCCLWIQCWSDWQGTRTCSCWDDAPCPIVGWRPCRMKGTGGCRGEYGDGAAESLDVWRSYHIRHRCSDPCHQVWWKRL